MDASDRAAQNRDQEHGPDPSSLTTSQIQREITHLALQLNLRIDGIVLSYDTRLSAIDRATDKFEASLTRVPTDVDRHVSQVQSVINERFDRISTELAGMMKLKDEQFRSIQQQFIERDVRVETAAKDTKISIDAALSAAEKATAKGAENSAATAAKSETAFAKQADQQAELFRTTTGALQNQINEMKQQITRIESIAIGQASQKTEAHMGTGMIITIILAAIAIMGFLLTTVGPLLRAGAK